VARMKSRRRKGEPRQAHRGRGRAYSDPNNDRSRRSPIRGGSRLLLVNCTRLPTRFLVTLDAILRDVCM